MDKTLYSEGYRAVVRILQEAREEAGLTQEELATRLGETQSFISKVERGERRLDVVELKQLSIALRIPFIELAKRIDASLSVGKS